MYYETRDTSKREQSDTVMADINLQAVHDELVLVAYEAGRMILSANPADIGTGTKLNCTLEKHDSYLCH